MQKANLKIGELLLYAGKITNEQLNEVLEIQRTTNAKIGEIIVEKGWLTSEDIVQALEFQLGFPRVDLSTYEINQTVATLIPESIVRKYKLISIDKRNNTLVVAMVDPLNIFAKDDVKLFTKMDLEPVIATSDEINKLIDRFYSSASTKRFLRNFLIQV